MKETKGRAWDNLTELNLVPDRKVVPLISLGNGSGQGHQSSVSSYGSRISETLKIYTILDHALKVVATRRESEISDGSILL